MENKGDPTTAEKTNKRETHSGDVVFTSTATPPASPWRFSSCSRPSCPRETKLIGSPKGARVGTQLFSDPGQKQGTLFGEDLF